MYIIKQYDLSMSKLKELCLSAVNTEILNDYIMKKGNVVNQKKIDDLNEAQKEFNSFFSTVVRDSRFSNASVFVLVEETKGKDPVVISRSKFKFIDKE